MTTTADMFDLDAAPMRIGAVSLAVRDLAAAAAFYQAVLGLRLLETTGRRAVLGAPGRKLLQLDGDPSLAPLDAREAGLFHTAFLMPSRGDLARWLAATLEAGVKLQGASDHIVSEAIYLADPEGNGIEVYADRPAARWRTPDGAVRMATERLDVPDLLAAAGDRPWAGFPEGGTVGHVHLQVGDPAAAERFYGDVLGFDIASRYPDASFFGSGGYHHQLAGNAWNSRGAGRRPDGMAGLAAVEIVVRDAADRDAILARAEAAGTAIERNAELVTLADPWGTRIVLTASTR